MLDAQNPFPRPRTPGVVMLNEEGKSMLLNQLQQTQFGQLRDAERAMLAELTVHDEVGFVLDEEGGDDETSDLRYRVTLCATMEHPTVKDAEGVTIDRTTRVSLPEETVLRMIAEMPDAFRYAIAQIMLSEFWGIVRRDARTAEREGDVTNQNDYLEPRREALERLRALLEPPENRTRDERRGPVTLDDNDRPQ